MQNEKITIKEFEALYKKYYKGVAGTVFKFRVAEDIADEIIQDTFVQAWTKIETLKDTKAFGGWVCTIARNLTLNHINKTKKRPTVVISATDSCGEEDSVETEVVLEASNLSESIEYENSLNTLRSVISGQKPGSRTSVAMAFYIEELSVKEICLKLNMKQNTVLSHLNRFRAIAAMEMKTLEAKGEVSICAYA